jgi:hypothetical protein
VVVATGALAGLAVISVTVLGVDALRPNVQAGHVDASFYLLVGGTLAGVMLAAGLTWRLLAPIGSLYRRGALSMVCSFATILLMLLCIPVYQLLGRTGLLGLTALSSIVAAILSQRARRWAYGR